MEQVKEVIHQERVDGPRLPSTGHPPMPGEP